MKISTVSIFFVALTVVMKISEGCQSVPSANLLSIVPSSLQAQFNEAYSKLTPAQQTELNNFANSLDPAQKSQLETILSDSSVYSGSTNNPETIRNVVSLYNSLDDTEKVQAISFARSLGVSEGTIAQLQSAGK